MLNTFCFLFLYWLAIYERTENITTLPELHVSWLCAAGSPYYFRLQQLNQRDIGFVSTLKKQCVTALTFFASYK